MKNGLEPRTYGVYLSARSTVCPPVSKPRGQSRLRKLEDTMHRKCAILWTLRRRSDGSMGNSELPILDNATYLAQGGLDSTLGWHFSTDPSVTFDKPYTLLWGFFGCVCAFLTQTTIEHGDTKNRFFGCEQVEQSTNGQTVKSQARNP